MTDTQALTVRILETPSLGDRSYLVHDGDGRVRGRPAAGHRPGAGPARGRRRPAHPRLRDPHPQRLRHRRLRARRGDRRGLPGQRRGRGLLRPHPDRATARSCRSGDRMRVRAIATPGPHLHPPLVRARSATTATEEPYARLHRRLAALRRDRPARPARRRAHRHPGPPPARLRPPARRRAARRRRGLPDPRLRLVLLRHASPTPPPRPSAQEKRVQPGADPGRGDLRPRAARRARRLAGVLRAHGAGQRRRPARARPVPAPTTADAAELRRRIEAGEWVVDLRNRTAFAAGHVAGHLQLRPRRAVRHLPRLADRVGHPADPARRDRRGRRRRPSASWSGSASTGPAAPRDRRPRRLDRPASWPRFPTATFADLAQVRHHRAVVVLDVRRADEHAARRGSRARSTSRCTSCRDRLDEVPAGEVWVHCAAGYRASVGGVAPRRRRSPRRRRRRRVRQRRGRRACTCRHRRAGRRRELAVAVLAGALIGLSLGALGGGGSILAVPVLVYVLGPVPRAGDHRLAGGGRRRPRWSARSAPAAPGTCCWAGARPSALVAIGRCGARRHRLHRGLRRRCCSRRSRR